MKYSIVLLLIILEVTGNALAGGEFTHRLTWRMPSSGDSSPNIGEVIWDGKSLGAISASNKPLAEMRINNNDTIRIDMPSFHGSAELDASFRRDTPYAYSRYIIIWYDKGAHLCFYREGKKYAVHTLAYSSYGHLTEKVERPFHLFLDGKDLGPMDLAVKYLDDYSWQEGDVLQMLSVYTLHYDGNPTLVPDPLVDFTNRLSKQHKVLVEEIMGVE